MKHLKKFVVLTWDGDVEYHEAVEGFTKNQLKLMNETLEMVPEILNGDGLNREFVQDNINDNGLLLLQILVNNID